MSLAGVHACFAHAQADRRLKGSSPVLLSIAAISFAFLLTNGQALAGGAASSAQCAPQSALTTLAMLSDSDRSPANQRFSPRSDGVRMAQTPGSRCCCSGCQNSTLPHCSWCS